MAKYRIAELVVEFSPQYDLAARVCEEYRTDTADEADFSIAVDENEIAATCKEYPQSSPAAAESFCIFRRFAEEAARRGAILLHAATVEVDGGAYAFSAPSGTGKSTHITLWRKTYGKRIGIINGDKPFLRLKDGVLTVYGSPWCGKEGWQRNTHAPLKALCFLSRGEKNTIAPLAADKALPRVFAQLLKPRAEEALAETMRFADLLIRTVPIYTLACDISSGAAKLSFETLVAQKKGGEPI